MPTTSKSIPSSFALAILIGYLLSELLTRHVRAPLAQGLGFFLGGLAVIPFSLKQCPLTRLLILAVGLGTLALVLSLVLLAFGSKW